MEDQSREDSQLRRPSVNSPWKRADDFATPRPSGWNGPSLPPIISIPHQRATTPSSSQRKSRDLSQNSATGEPAPKKARHDFALNGVASQPKSYRPYSSRMESPFSADTTTTSYQDGEHEKHSESDRSQANSPTLCAQCRRLTLGKSNRFDAGQNAATRIGPNSDNDPEVNLVTQAAAVGLTKILETLNSGLSSLRNGINHQARDQLRQNESRHQSVGPIDLKEELNSILTKIYHANDLTKELVSQIKESGREYSSHLAMWQHQYDQLDAQHNKRRSPTAAANDENVSRVTDQMEMPAPIRTYSRQRSLMTTMSPDGLPPIISDHRHAPTHSYLGEQDRSSTIMNPPPTPNRALPSPPNRDLRSPTPGHFPLSPTSRRHSSSSSQSITLPPPGSLGTSNKPYLPSIASPYSSDGALQAHTAALQHEVSVQKIALSSLQGEHDKLLAALSRSQTRASALEKKHSVSDNEIVTLTEEKFRLLTQVQELEKDVEDLTRSRDDARSSAIQEASQYVDIVKKASKLEKLAAEERQRWNELKTEMEEKLRIMSVDTQIADDAVPLSSQPRVRERRGSEDAMEVTDDIPSADSAVKHEPSSPEDLHFTHARQDPTPDLRAEIRELRARCAKAEDTLKIIREESQSAEGVVRALDRTRISIIEKADQVLREGR